MSNLDNEAKKKLMGLDGPIRIGDVVRLKSGGAPMVVSEINGDEAICEWHVKDSPKTKPYKLHCLEKTHKEQLPFLHFEIAGQPTEDETGRKIPPWEQREKVK
ncbi:MAG: DUF2158 domain-containing protein [Rhodoplanes sp.]